MLHSREKLNLLAMSVTKFCELVADAPMFQTGILRNTIFKW
jgi:hypothetical protein